MINANELRIGNWVKLPEYRKEISDGDYGEYAQITAWGSSGMCHWQSPCISLGGGVVISGDYAKELEPIPLSPELLERCGFEKSPIWHDGVCYEKLILIRTDNNGDCVFEFSIWTNQYKDWSMAVEDQYLGHISHLHQLQNAMFTLCGHELTLTPKS